MMDYHTNSSVNNVKHPYSSCCGYCHHDEYTFGEDSSMNHVVDITTTNQQEEPFKYNYLLNLIIAPDLNAYLSITNDDLYYLPIHLQKLVVEAREEMLLNNNDNSAQLRLQKVRTLVWLRSEGDFSILMNSLIELVSDEQELQDLLR